MILDIHTHHPAPQPHAVISVEAGEFAPVASQAYSVGIHPWSTLEAPSEVLLGALEEAAAHPQVVAIGECGIDAAAGGPMFRQIQLFRFQAELAGKAGKPLVVHAVKAPDIIIGLRKELKPSVPWIIHGFRGKPSVADMYLRAGCLLSFGELFNVETLRMVPSERYLCETDCSPLTIEEILRRQSEAVGRDLTSEVADNARRLGFDIAF